MYVCICNALSNRRVEQVARESGCRRPGEVFEACGCRARCGQCVKVILATLRELSPPPALDGTTPLS